jgi:phosphatidylserine/phosphatidylglycerophosphate/cardiolipin synthase-like enzyme
MSAVDGFLTPVVTELLLTGLARLRAEGPGAHLYLGSPWLSNFPLFPGVFAGSFPYLLPDTEPSEVAAITNVVSTWRAYGGPVTIVVQNYGRTDWPRKDNVPSNQEELKLLERCLAAGVNVFFGKSFHSKFIVCPDVVVSGSANMTYSGYYRNVEQIHVYRPSSSAQDYASARTACLNHVATAQGLGLCEPPSRLTGQLLSVNVAALKQYVSSASA